MGERCSGVLSGEWDSMVLCSQLLQAFLCRWTELTVHASKVVDSLSLHSFGLDVESVEVGGVTAQFELHLPATAEVVGEFSDGYSIYRNVLQLESEPGLVVHVPHEQRGLATLPVRVYYSASNPSAGMGFWGQYACTDNQVGVKPG
jgi:hypothetical protein